MKSVVLRNSVGLFLGAQIVALLLGYTLRGPDLQRSSANSEAARHEKEQSATDRSIALQRAQICQPLMSELPITDGASPYFSSRDQLGQRVIDKNRPFPVGTVVCDRFGNTAIVGRAANGRTPTVTDIRALPVEEMQAILVERGVMPRQLNANELPKIQRQDLP